MISFSCTYCGLKLTVKPEFAGRSSRCPTCKQPLVVPSPSQTQTEVAPGQIDGSDSSLAKVGFDGGVTLDRGPSSARLGQESISEVLARRTKNNGRYIIDGEIARGGMGSVLRAVDCDIRREVAVKYLLDQSDPGKKLRFVEEAQITGQLEHPNIVPVHELGVDNQRRLFFSMKMVKGRSLAQVLEELRTNSKQGEKEWSLGRLLNILVNVCNALSYAHSRGVIHRDAEAKLLKGQLFIAQKNLAPLQGMKLTSLSLRNCGQVRDLKPLSGMPLVKLSLGGCGQVRDLAPLEGMPLNELYFPPKFITKGIDVIRQMKGLNVIGADDTVGMPAADFWKKYDAGEFK